MTAVVGAEMNQGIVDIDLVTDRIADPRPKVWVIIDLLATGEIVIDTAVVGIRQTKGGGLIKRVANGVENPCSGTAGAAGPVPDVDVGGWSVGIKITINPEPAGRRVHRCGTGTSIGKQRRRRTRRGSHRRQKQPLADTIVLTHMP